MNHKQTPNGEPTQAERLMHRKKALELIQRTRTMVLATHAAQFPWAAPVYYLFKDTAFYFLSSPETRHTRQALSSSTCAAAIYADGDRLDQIEGVQMTGAIALIESRIEKMTVLARYVAKFPLAKDLIGDPATALKLNEKTNLYRFSPVKVYYMDNRTGFGRRLEIVL